MRSFLPVQYANVLTVFTGDISPDFRCNLTDFTLFLAFSCLRMHWDKKLDIFCSVNDSYSSLEHRYVINTIDPTAFISCGTVHLGAGRMNFAIALEKSGLILLLSRWLYSTYIELVCIPLFVVSMAFTSSLPPKSG